MTMTSDKTSDQLDCERKPAVGVSRCLLGDSVRYDGDSKYHELVVSCITPFARLHPFCPEVAAGLGVPRQPVQLQYSSRGIEAVGVDAADLNVTAALNATNCAYVRQLTACKGLCGYILKARSPSCGRGSTPVYAADGELTHQVSHVESGLFARQLSQGLPHLVLAEESDFLEREGCWRFLSACYLVWRDYWQQPLEPPLDALLADDLTAADVWPRKPAPTPAANSADANRAGTIHSRASHAKPCNKKAVHWERLSEYWQKNLSAD